MKNFARKLQNFSFLVYELDSCFKLERKPTIKHFKLSFTIIITITVCATLMFNQDYILLCSLVLGPQ